MFVSPRLTNEEIYLAQKFARVALRTHNVTSFSHLVNRETFAPDVARDGDLPRPRVGAGDPRGQLEPRRRALRRRPDRQAGDPATAPGRSTSVRPANRTAEFADLFLQCAPDAETLVVQAIVAEAARLAGQAPAPELVAGVAGLSAGAGGRADRRATRTPSPRRRRRSPAPPARCWCSTATTAARAARATSRWLAAAGAALGCGVLPLHEKSNAQGLLDMGANPAWYPGYRPVSDPAAIEDLEKDWSVSLRDLDTAPVDIAAPARPTRPSRWPSSSARTRSATEALPAELREGLAAAEFLVVADLFPTKTAAAAHVVLPAAGTPETSGTMTNSERRVQMLMRAIPPRAGVEVWQLLTDLAGGDGPPLQDEVPDGRRRCSRRSGAWRRSTATWTSAARAPRAIWDASRSPLAPQPVNGAASAPAVHAGRRPRRSTASTRDSNGGSTGCSRPDRPGDTLATTRSSSQEGNHDRTASRPGGPRDRRARRRRRAARVRQDPPDPVGELRLARRARGDRLGAHQQVLRGLRRQALLRGPAVRRPARAARHRRAPRRCSAPSTPTCSRTPARPRTSPSTSRSSSRATRSWGWRCRTAAT